MLKTHVMKMNTENTNCFIYETEELLIELLGATFTISLNKSVRIFGQVQKIGADQELKQHILSNLPITKNGYLYIYVSNETPNVDVLARRTNR